jgi:hypothetical protein
MQFAIGPEFLPSYVDHFPNNLIVAAGDVVEFTEPQDIDAIEVHGTLRIRADLRFINLTVASGGVLDIGTAADPVLTPITLTKKDVPLDTTFDPFQWGHGIQVFGTMAVRGQDLGPTWDRDTNEPLYLPEDWNILFESENPSETMRRGHIAIIHTGQCDFRFAAIIGMGRTTGAILDNTSLDLTHIGTNQIAKYAFHAHHVAHHDAGSTHGGVHILGCYLDGLNGNKWGITDHSSPGFHAENNIVCNFTGACMVTEDGNELDYLFKNNLCFGSLGNGKGEKENMMPESFTPGATGMGIWHHSPTGRTIGNVCKDNNIDFAYMYIPNPNGLVIPPQVSPTEFDGNKSINGHRGFEEWRSPPMVINNLTCINNDTAVFMGTGEPGAIILNNPQFTGRGTSIGTGIHSSAAYTGLVEIHGGKITGFLHGIRDAGLVQVDGLDCRGNGMDVSFDVLPVEAHLDNMLFDTCHFGRQPDAPWTPARELTLDEYWMVWNGEGPSIWMRNRNGDGKSYALVTKNFQDGSSEAPYQCPTPGITRQECWDRYGLAALGYVWGPDAVEPPGIPLARAVEMDSFTYETPPRVVLIAPSERSGFASELRSQVILTGGATSAFLQWDNGPINPVFGTQGWPPYQRLTGAVEGQFTEGSHIGRTWAGDANGNRIESSMLEFPFVVGENPDPPDPPPVEVWEPASIGPPFMGDNNFRVRNGLIERKV